MNLSRLSINRPIFLTCIVLTILLVGFLCLNKLGVDQFPDVTFPVVVTHVGYPGASPEEVETLISKPIEDELSSTAGINRLSSTNQESLAIIVTEFSLGTDIKYAEQQIRDKVATVRGKLPKDIDEPVVSRVDVTDQAIVRLSLTGDLPPAKLYDVAEYTVKPWLEQAKDVGKVEILGGSKREIKVEVDRHKLKAHELSLQTLASRIASSAQNVPIGKINSGSKETLFRTIGEYKSIDQIKDTVVNFFGSDVPVTVANVATVTDSLQDEKSRAFFEDHSAIFLDVHKQSGSNTVAVTEGVFKRLAKINDQLKAKNLNVKLALVRDGARFIRMNVEDVKQSITLGVILAVVVVFLFIGNIRSTLITGLALPNSLLGAFILMYLMGFTINVMTLLALSLAVGLLIDDAIVVRENIFRRLEDGESPKEAAEKGTTEVTLAVIATTFTVIAVFLPVGFLSGTVGQFFKQFGLTIVFAMLISLFDALTMAPMLSAYLAGKTNTKSRIGRLVEKLSDRIDGFQDFLAKKYGKILDFTLRKPATILAIAVVIFVFSIGLGRSVKSTFLPNSDNGEFTVSLEMPPGTSLDAMEEAAKKVEAELKKFTEVDRVAVTIGNSAGESNVANMYVALVNFKKRVLRTNEIKALVREHLVPYAYTLPKVTDVDIVNSGIRPFNLNVSGENLDEVSKIVESIVAKFKKIPGLVDVDSNYRLGKPEFQVQMDPTKIIRYGVLTGVAGQELRGQMEGVVPAKFRENGEEYDIRVRLKPEQRDLQAGFHETWVPNINNNLVKIGDISKGILTQGPAKISRFNRARTIRISGDLAPGGALGNIRKEAEEILAKENMPPGMNYSFQGQAEDFQDLKINMVIAVVMAITFVYLILASLYESFITPLTIMLALPLAVAGALIALFLFNQSMNIFSMIGMIMLLGLVTKNSILLVDYTLQLIAQGKSRNEALKEAGLKRLRPILMTTVALIAGILPIAMGLSEVARARQSMGIAIIGGLISSTMLTLVVIPAAFGFIDSFRAWLGQLLSKIFVAKTSEG